MLELRPYQEEIINEVRAHLRSGSRSVLIQCPTGSGKTVLAAHILRNVQRKGKRAWFNVHRRELVRQSVKTLTEAAGIEVGIVASGMPRDRDQLVQVCMIGTLRRRRYTMEPPAVIVWDECHHVAATTWAAIFNAYPDAIHIGLSATPQRLDGAGLGKYFEHMVNGPATADLIDSGSLSGYKMFAPTRVDLDGVRIQHGDYNRADLDMAMSRSQVTGDVVEHYLKLAPYKRMVLFAWSISASNAMAERFNARGITAEHVDGKTPTTDREASMERFKSGATKILCNVDLFGEGIDVPAMECVALLRPTHSLSLYLQQVGRALRPHPGKEHAIILDHAGNSDRFGLPDDERTWSLDRQPRPKKSDAPLVKRCPSCFAVIRLHVTTCPWCEYVLPVAERQIAEVDGNLHENAEASRRQIERARIRLQGQARTLEDLIEVGRERGYKNPAGWARHVWAGRQARGLAAEIKQSFRTGA